MDETTKSILVRCEIEALEEWNKWSLDLPYLQFPPDWEIKIIPPTMMAVVRFKVKRRLAKVSIYFDPYDRLGYVGEPYWEIYPSKDDDVERYLMNETEDLLKGIEAALDEQDPVKK